MNKVLEFLGVIFLVNLFWIAIAMIFKKTTAEKRDFKHWLDEDD
jgi:hypothetical protein